MRFRQDEEIPIAARPSAPPPNANGGRGETPWLFAGFLAVAFGSAAGLGIVLGLLAGARTWIGDEHWSATVQAHGRIQLWSFAVVVVSGLAPEFLARFNARRPPGARRRVIAAAAMSGGALLSGAGQAMGGNGHLLMLAGSVLSLAGAVASGWLLLSIRPARPLLVDLHPLFFAAAAAWLAVGALLFVRAADGAINGILPLAESRAMAEVILRGFVLNVVVAVTLRALPGHAGTRMLGRGQQATMLVLLQLSTITWLGGSGAVGSGGHEWAMRTGDLLAAGTFLVYTAMTGLFRLQRPRAQDAVNRMVRLAWAGGVAWAVMLAWFAAAPGTVSAQAEGAVRHTLMLGFMAPLMLAFAHIVLARFGSGRIERRRLLTAGFALLALAWPGRVIAGLAFEPDDPASRLLMTASGLLAAAGLALGAAVAANTARTLMRASQPGVVSSPAGSPGNTGAGKRSRSAQR